jgi:hypothetical protein
VLLRGLGNDTAVHPDELTPEERMTVLMAEQVRDSGDVLPLLARLEGPLGPELVRDTLRLLGELDLDLLVAIALDALTGSTVEPARAHDAHLEIRRRRRRSA